MHKIKVFIPEVIYSTRNGLLMALFVPHNDLYGETPRERGTFIILQVYKRAAHRVKLSKLNQTGSTWTEFLSEENFFFSLLSIVFLCTANRPDENELIQFFELS